MANFIPYLGPLVAAGLYEASRLREAGQQPTLADAIAPFRFRAPLAPNMAARREGRELNLDEIVSFCARHITDARAPLLIEGAGGLMSPVTDEATCLDWIATLRLPTLLVAGTYLGAISHTLTAVAALRARGCTLAAIALDETPDGVGLAETRNELVRFLPGVTVVAIARGATDFQELTRACI